ncbi:unnamed protein product [Ilex paraguariensis]|uniref:Uncharacterized protein n=1 Tax=Ilex paraguariensis TaxID=185542 RepID=A0ABC8QU20_9AQUA
MNENPKLKLPSENPSTATFCSRHIYLQHTNPYLFFFQKCLILHGSFNGSKTATIETPLSFTKFWRHLTESSTSEPLIFYVMILNIRMRNRGNRGVGSNFCDPSRMCLCFRFSFDSP